MIKINPELSNNLIYTCEIRILSLSLSSAYSKRR